jgi:signal peptidase I
MAEAEIRGTKTPPNHDSAADGQKSAFGRIAVNSLILLASFLIAIFCALYLGRTFNANVGILLPLALSAVLLVWWLIARARGGAAKRTPLSKLQKAAVVITAVLLAIVCRAFIFQPFNIVGNSMAPTLLDGDYVLALKYPRIIFGRSPDLGDLVVFRLPSDTSRIQIGRVVGLPGDRIQMIHGVLNINGAPVEHGPVDDFRLMAQGGVQTIKRYRERLPNNVSYATLDLVDNGPYDNTPLYAVPPQSYFIMGDNRDNATDSRVPGRVGYVPSGDIVGPIRVILWPNAGTATEWRSWFP